MFVFYAHVGIHQVRILVFANYQTCPVPLNVIFMGLLCCMFIETMGRASVHLVQVYPSKN